MPVFAGTHVTLTKYNLDALYEQTTHVWRGPMDYQIQEAPRAGSTFTVSELGSSLMSLNGDMPCYISGYLYTRTLMCICADVDQYVVSKHWHNELKPYEEYTYNL